MSLCPSLPSLSSTAQHYLLRSSIPATVDARENFAQAIEPDSVIGLNVARVQKYPHINLGGGTVGQCRNGGTG